MTGRTISFYHDIPTHEIDQAISWLNNIKHDCDHQISSLKLLKAERERSQKWRNDINALAKAFCDPDALHLNLETRTNIIQQRLGCNIEKAQQIAEIVTRWAKNEYRKQRDKKIYNDRITNDMSAAECAKKYGMTRQQIYNIVKQQEPKLMR
ncbi:MAG: Mor transcription activator family protein [Alphaproteobacteria bacterium]